MIPLNITWKKLRNNEIKILNYELLKSRQKVTELENLGAGADEPLQAEL